MDALTISAVERETKLSKDLLRAWERRYGFPMPLRALNGERRYPTEQVERLRLMKRLVDQGYRPGTLAKLSAGQLLALPPRPPRRPDGRPAQQEEPQNDGVVERLLETIRRNPRGFRHAMGEQLARRGLERFVQHVAAPLTLAVGQCWQEGSLQISDEQLYTEETARVLRQTIAALPADRHGPGILLTTLPGEPHGLGLLMTEALLALDGATCISLGTETPLAEIVRAAPVYGVDIVALSFSAASPQRQIGAALRRLRQSLPAEIGLWAGGAGIGVQGVIEGVHLLPSLESGRRALAEWRLLHGLARNGIGVRTM
jgi:DNA-binding transcriptional MerR regulator/methylmalonyl-CoA mutase cobalamin-binding subunit